MQFRLGVGSSVLGNWRGYLDTKGKGLDQRLRLRLTRVRRIRVRE